MMDFPPPHRGLTLQVLFIILLTLLSATFIVLASQQPIGLRFTIYVLIAGFSFFPLPFLTYWLYSLNRANYNLDRETLTLTWGLRMEKIPVSEIEWVRPVQAMETQIHLPFLHPPGAITGTRHHRDFGTVEFLASDRNALLVVATSRRIYVISPEDAIGFMQNIQRVIEQGSLSPVAPQSLYPTFIVGQAWESKLTRYFWLSGLFLNIGLLIWVTLLIPTLETIPLGFLPSGYPGDPVPGAGLILLPIVSLLIYMTSWVAGLSFFRRPDKRPLGYIVWAGSDLSTLLFLVAVMFIVITPI